jgi:hypothetical protein
MVAQVLCPRCRGLGQMQAMQLNITETLSAAVPPRVSAPAQAPAQGESFAAKWQQELAPSPAVKPASHTGADAERDDEAMHAGHGDGQSAQRDMKAATDSDLRASRGSAVIGTVSSTVKGRSKASLNSVSAAKPAAAAKPANQKSSVNSTIPDDGAVNMLKGSAAQVQVDATQASQNLDKASNQNAQTDRVGPVAAKGSKPQPAGDAAKNGKAHAGGNEVGDGAGTVTTDAAKTATLPSAPASGAKHAGGAVEPPAEAHHTGHAEAAPVQAPALNAAAGETAASALAAKPGRITSPLTPAGSADAVQGRVPTVLASSPASLDVGVFDGTHGWLRIRAELGTGGTVNASLTASAAAHDSLRTALPQMASFLGSEAVSVSKLAVHRFGETSSLGASGSEAREGGGADRQNTSRETGADAANPSTALTSDFEGDPAPAVASSAEVADVAGLQRASAAPWLAWNAGALASSSGGWLNVSA